MVMLLKYCIQYVRKFGRLSSGHRTWEGQFSLQTQVRAMTECSNYHTILLISHVSKIMLKILQDRPQQYVKQEIPNVEDGCRKGRGTRYQIATIYWIIEKASGCQKNTYFCFTDYAKAFEWITANCGKFLQRGIPDYLTCLLRNVYAG